MFELTGTDVLRSEDHHLLVGDTTFVADRNLPGKASAHFIVSEHAHARIRSIATDEAEQLPGVLAVVTAADIGHLHPMPGSPAEYPAGVYRPFLASDRVRYVGEPVVAIVAETAAIAADAAELVFIDYEPLTAVVGLDNALRNDVVLFEHIGTNLVQTQTGGRDPISLDDFDVVVSATFENQRLAPCPIETRSGAAWWSDDGRLHYYASCQGVHPFQKMFSIVYGIPEHDVQVITADVGGSFGAKGRPYTEDFLLPYLAQRVGRPVMWVPTRSNDMVGLGHSRAQRNTVTVAGDADGRIRAIHADIFVDAGAYVVAAPALAANAGRMLPGPFDVEQVSYAYNVVVTNTTPLAAYRGAGRPESGAIVDRAIDLFAAKAGCDAIAVRRKNLLRPEQLPWTNPSGVTYDSGDYPEALELVLEAVDIAALRSQQQDRRSQNSPKRLGFGLSNFVDRTAGVPGTEFGSITLEPDGSLYALTGSSPYGQGHYTTWQMLISERTGIPIERITIFHGDTDVVPTGGITGGSRSVQKAGSAIALTADRLVDRAKETAAHLLEASVGDVVLDRSRGVFHVAGSPHAATVAWDEIATFHYANTSYERNRSDDDGLYFSCESNYDTDAPSVPYGAYGAVVEVDIETGEVKLQRMVTVDDAGTIVNPMLALGQVHGGLAQGIAQALYESFDYDDDGNPLTNSFLTYLVPSAAELPSYECRLTEHPSPYNLLGAKGIAESGTIGAVGAVQNAVVDALADLGVRHLDMPLSPWRVHCALRTATLGNEHSLTQ